MSDIVIIENGLGNGGGISQQAVVRETSRQGELPPGPLPGVQGPDGQVSAFAPGNQPPIGFGGGERGIDTFVSRALGGQSVLEDAYSQRRLSMQEGWVVTLRLRLSHVGTNRAVEIIPFEQAPPPLWNLMPLAPLPSPPSSSEQVPQVYEGERQQPCKLQGGNGKFPRSHIPTPTHSPTFEWESLRTCNSGGGAWADTWRPSPLQKAYLSCRMENGLMTPEALSKFGLDIDVDLAASQKAQRVSKPTPLPICTILHPSAPWPCIPPQPLFTMSRGCVLPFTWWHSHPVPRPSRSTPRRCRPSTRRALSLA